MKNFLFIVAFISASLLGGKPSYANPLSDFLGNIFLQKIQSNDEKVLSTDRYKDQKKNGGLEEGEESRAVKAWQSFLQDQGYYDGPIDGKFGTKTTEATKYFQKNMGLSKVDGKLGRETIEAARREANEELNNQMEDATKKDGIPVTEDPEVTNDQKQINNDNPDESVKWEGEGAYAYKDPEYSGLTPADKGYEGITLEGTYISPNGLAGLTPGLVPQEYPGYSPFKEMLAGLNSNNNFDQERESSGKSFFNEMLSGIALKTAENTTIPESSDRFPLNTTKMEPLSASDVAQIIKQDPEQAAKFLDHLVDTADLKEGDPRLNSLVQQLIDQQCPGGICTATQERVQALVEATGYDKIYNGIDEKDKNTEDKIVDSKNIDAKSEEGIVVTGPVEEYGYDCTDKKNCKKLEKPERVVEVKSLVDGTTQDVELQPNTNPKVGEMTTQKDGLVKIPKVRILDTKAILQKTGKLIPAPDSKEVVLDENDKEQVGKLNFVSPMAKQSLMESLPKAQETAEVVE